MSSHPKLLIPLLAAMAFQVQAQDYSTNPMGYNSITCLKSSDTIVGVPFRQAGSRFAKVDSVAGSTVTIKSSPNFTVDEFNDAYYLKFASGAKDGSFYTVTDTTSDTLTLDLNGDDISTVVEDDEVVIAKYWTLDELFPPAEATTAWGPAPDFIPNGHAIMASNGTTGITRRTQVLIPNTVGSGINLAPTRTFYIYNKTTAPTSITWQSTSAGPLGDFQLAPDTYFIIRHPSSVTNPTVYRSIGSVELGTVTIPLGTNTVNAQDNYVALMRPVDVPLNELNLAESGAFVASTGTTALARRDTLLVFSNAAAVLNRAPSATYFYFSGNWHKAVSGTPISNTDVIPAGGGFIVRKLKTTLGTTSFWPNPF